MKRVVLISIFTFTTLAIFGQTGTLSGTITDRGTSETLIGASVVYLPGKGGVSNIDGRFNIEVPYGTYTVSVSYVGYQTVTEAITIDRVFTNRDFALQTTTLREVEVVADLAVAKETPVAFSNITPLQITQELGSSELPLLLNTTPGVYVSPTGGQDGGARVSIRGFQDRNITVMIDGIPINNMDNGNVFWASTFGLDAVLSTMQVQRGMTSSRLAIPAIGGTINYITKSVENKPSLVVKQDYGSFNTLRTSLSYNSGNLGKGWGLSVAGSYRKTEGYAVQQFKEEYFYFAKVQKVLGNHIISATALGSPVRYGLRRDKQKIVVYDKEYAADLFRGEENLYQQLSQYSVADNIGRQTSNYARRDSLGEAYGWTLSDFRSIASENDFIDTAGVISRGYRYNNHWGYLNGQIQHERIRDYHKPIFSVRDFWQISDRVYLSNVVYYSYGLGGQTGRVPSLGFGDYDRELQADFQGDYDGNTVGGLFGPPVFPEILPDARKSGVILNKSFDNHYWLGWLSTLEFNINENFTFAGGLDVRTFRSEQYIEVHDLLGGEYFVPSVRDFPEDRGVVTPDIIYREGDKYDFYNDNYMRWAAFFSELKYNKDSWRAFVNLSGVSTGYKRVDYFTNRDFTADGNRYPNAIGYGDVLFYNGSDVLVAAGSPNGAVASFSQSGDTTFVNNPANNFNGYAPTGQSYILGGRQVNYGDSETSVSETPWKNIPGFTLKGGLGYSINEFHSVFTNVGYLSRTPRFRNVVEFGQYNQFLRDVENEKITSVELGYNYNQSRFALSVNAYYTDWRNRPINNAPFVFLPDRGIAVRVNLNDMNAVHQGIEFTSNYLINKRMSIDVFASLGDWRWNSAKTVNFFDDFGDPIYVVDGNNRPTDSLVTISFDAKGVLVGDAPQTQLGGAFEYKFAKNAYIKTRYTYFDRHYSNFDPLQLQDDRRGKQSWKMPGYGLVSVFGGYRFDWDKVHLDFNLIVDNLFDVRYLADGQNNEGTALVTTDYLIGQPLATVTFDANSTAVYFGLPRMFSISARLTL